MTPGKIEEAFAGGYDPALELATHHTKRGEETTEAGNLETISANLHILLRKEQDQVDSIIHGKESGRYFVLLGPKVRHTFCELIQCDWPTNA